VVGAWTGRREYSGSTARRTGNALSFQSVATATLGLQNPLVRSCAAVQQDRCEEQDDRQRIGRQSHGDGRGFGCRQQRTQHGNSGNETRQHRETRSAKTFVRLWGERIGKEPIDQSEEVSGGWRAMAESAGQGVVRRARLKPRLVVPGVFVPYPDHRKNPPLASTSLELSPRSFA